MAGAARNYAVSQSWDAIMGGLRERYQAVIDRADRSAGYEPGWLRDAGSLTSVGPPRIARSRRAAPRARAPDATRNILHSGSPGAPETADSP